MEKATEQPNLLFNESQLSEDLYAIALKVQNGERLTFDEGVTLYEKGSLGYLGILANFIRERLHGHRTYFNRNFHIEPTNLCVFTCKFCSYSRLLKQESEGWVMSKEQIWHLVDGYKDQPVTEVHIVGGVHPKQNLEFYCELFEGIRKRRPELHIKALTPVEMEYIFRKAKVSYSDGMKRLKDAGLQSMPGGGAEIFDEEIREKICADKCTSQQWLEIHEAAHELGMKTNATMLYGHIEEYRHRVDHMERLRQLQDKTGGFQAFIPLKFRNKQNEMADVPEVSVVEDLRNYAVSRIYLDNFPHIKSYWAMIGRSTAQLSLNFGVSDIDGTIDDTTKIYSMAGAEEQHPRMTTTELVELIRQVGRRPLERDTLYHVIRDYNTGEQEAVQPEPDRLSLN
ncbi:aminodeoxyfutalosine synthase [Anseongella ginsenosidimutans]|uniref:Aminodeoxyfutalosine synthase n=1 Tax=Anseongella ginsenosidimutans TaxID=496056 RepID=A0A4R3KS89_9SPHI|nr:aminofutalosine synthase MqnE [Anseongella ginsenosidimutans]QEC53207.1 aminofutalosine synthase MqnE [Anseongella ginsenosidimutans]TCS87840.1 aminodeoxyfutalosine synthase [Anseongella ginsenosidimutans]